MATYVRHQIYRLCEQKDQVEVLELNAQLDHVHLIVSLPPKYAVSEFMGYLKWKLALRLFQHYEHLGRRYWGRWYVSKSLTHTKSQSPTDAKSL